MINEQLQIAGAARYAEMTAARSLESISGPGSTLANTVAARRWLANIIRDRSIASLIDCPCGDHRWMAEVDLGAVSYLGYDVLPAVVAAAVVRRGDRIFGLLNAITHVPERADLIICRDLLVHLTFAHALRALANFRASGATWLAVTSFPKSDNHELGQSHPGWGWRPLNMSAAPFDLGDPISSVEEDEGQGKSLCLYRLNPS